MFTSAEQKFIQHHRVGRLATADATGVPHVIPVCFVRAANNIYITVDEKPKTSAPKTIKRLRNIAENINVAMVVDEYDEDLGNDLENVHGKGQTVKNLEFTLENEDLGSNVEYVYFLNRIVDKSQKYAIVALLKKYKNNLIALNPLNGNALRFISFVCKKTREI